MMLGNVLKIFFFDTLTLKTDGNVINYYEDFIFAEMCKFSLIQAWMFSLSHKY